MSGLPEFSASDLDSGTVVSLSADCTICGAQKEWCFSMKQNSESRRTATVVIILMTNNSNAVTLLLIWLPCSLKMNFSWLCFPKYRFLTFILHIMEESS